MSQTTRTKELIERMSDLRLQQRATNAEIRRLRRSISADSRPWWHCLRCGHDWQGHVFGRAPRHCARCHSSGWDREPMTSKARKPEDPPNPNWEYKGRRRVRVMTKIGDNVSDAADSILRMPTVGELRGLPPPPSIDLSGDTFSVGLPPLPDISHWPLVQEEQPERTYRPPFEPVPIVGVDWGVETGDIPIIVLGHKDEIGNLIQDEVFVNYVSKEEELMADLAEMVDFAEEDA